MTDAPQETPVACAVITQDMRCARCGYNLRGLTYEGQCPECGTLVAKSVHGNLLRYSEPTWLDKIRLGIVLKLWNLLIVVGLSLAAGIAVMIGLPQAVLQLTGLVAGCLGLWALFLVTTPEPTAGLTEASITLRKVIRTAAVVGFFGGQLQGTSTAIGLATALYFVGSVLALAGIVSLFGEFVYFRRFARRIPDEELARSTTVVMWGFVTISSLGTIAAIVFALIVPFAAPGAAVGTAGAVAPPAGPGVLGGVLMFGTCIFGLGGLIFGIWNIALLFRYRGAFRTALAQAWQLEGEELPPLAEPDI